MMTFKICTLGFFFIIIGRCQALDFKFKTPAPPVIGAYWGTSLTIDCTTTDPNATTSLWFKRVSSSSSLKPLNPDNSKVIQGGAVYTITRIQYSDRGIYNCKASSSSGVNITWPENSGLLIVTGGQSGPDLIASPEQMLVAVGESANFTCQTNTYVQPVVLKWYKNGDNGFEPVPPSQEDEQRTSSKVTRVLMITKATVSSQPRDVFQCQLTYGIDGKTKSDYVTLTIRAMTAPDIQSFPNSPVTVNESQSWTVSCTVEGFHLPNITWLKDGKELPVCKKGSGVQCSQGDIYITDDTTLKAWLIRSKLDIRSVQRPTGSDASNYTCSAVNSMGSARKSVRVVVQGRPVIKKASSNFLGMNKVYCEVESIQPRPKLQWQFQPWHCTSHESVCTPVPDHWENLPFDHIVSPPISQSTLRSQVTIPNRIEEGFYKCTAKNGFGQDSHDLVFSQHVVLVAAEEAVLNAQQTLVIRCIHREANFDAWTKDGSILSTYLDGRMNVSTRVHTVTLKVFNLTVNDSGIYTCRTRMPKANASVEITVREIYKPKILRFSNQTAFKGNLTTVLYCNVSANPEASISWTKEGKSLSIAPLMNTGCKSRLPGYYQTGSEQSALLICHPNHKDNSGRYRCTAKNKLGSQSRTAFVNVLESTAVKIINSPTNNIVHVTLGNSVNVTCKGTGNPKPRVQWLKLEEGKSTALHKSDPDPSQATLYIESVEEQHPGNYSCFAQSSLGSSELYLQIVLKELQLEPENAFSSALAIGLGVGLGALLIIAIIVILLIYRCHNKQIAEYREVFYSQGSDYKFDPKRTLIEQSSELPYDPDWEFPEERLLLGEVLDAGNFGQVYVAEAIGIMTFDARNKSPAAFKRRSTIRRRVSTAKLDQDNKGQQYNRTTVAVKTLKAGATGSDYQDLVSELKIMIHVGQHKNTINLLGACTRGKQLMLIIEYAPHGSLNKFLRKKREIFEPTWVKETNSPEVEFTIADLAMESYQVARGLEYLASRKCVHRDVATRNVLVAEGYVLKISDFGLARDIYKEDEYVKTTTGVLPVKWMALESLFDKVYTEKSDVWSFGVLLWELFTLGGSPYPLIPTQRLLDSIVEGYRMECPLNCPVEMYTLMRDCWLQIPEQRPNFAQIVERLGKILENSAAKAATSYISLVNDNQPSDYYLRPVDSSGVPNAATAFAGSNDPDEDLAHAPLPPIPISEFENYAETTDRERRQPDKDMNGATGLRNLSVENESGIDLEDDNLIEDDVEEGPIKADFKEPTIGLRNGQSKPKHRSGDTNDGRKMETAL